MLWALVMGGTGSAEQIIKFVVRPNPDSQASMVKGFIGLGSRVAQKGLKARMGFGIRDALLPRLFLLACEKESGEVRQLGLFVRRQRFANLNDFRGCFTHNKILALKHS
jgi:hypothetical protein